MAITRTNANSITALPAGVGGKVLQVVSDSDGTSLSTTSTSFVDGGLSVNVTPTSTNSKILVQFTTQTQAPSQGTVVVGIFRDSTNITAGFGSFSSYNSNGIIVQGGSGMVLDSPSTTSQITYKVRFYSFTGSEVYLSSASNFRILTVMEIAE